MTDVFRKEYRPLGDEAKEKMLVIKNKAQSLYDEIVNTKGDARMLAIAVTNLEQAVMWAVKALTG